MYYSTVQYSLHIIWYSSGKTASGLCVSEWMVCLSLSMLKVTISPSKLFFVQVLTLLPCVLPFSKISLIACCHSKERDEGGSLWEGERCIVLHSFELPSRAVKSSVLQAGTVETLHCIATCHWAVYCSLLQRSLSVCKHRLFVEETEWGPQLLQYSANKQQSLGIQYCSATLNYKSFKKKNF